MTTIYEVERDIKETSEKLRKAQTARDMARTMLFIKRLDSLYETKDKLLFMEGQTQLARTTPEVISWGGKTLHLIISMCGLIRYYNDMYMVMHRERAMVPKPEWERRIKRLTDASDELGEYMNKFLNKEGKKENLELSFNLSNLIYEKAFTDRERKVYDGYAEKV
jgi:hypothetical protein